MQNSTNQSSPTAISTHLRSPDRAFTVGVDVGGTTTQVVLCDSEMTILARAEGITPAATGGEQMMDTVARLIDGLLSENPGRLRTIGIGVAGVVDREAGTILVASDSFTAWAGFNVSGYLRDRFGVSAFLDNDANAFLRGELTAGVAAGRSDALGIILGTGVGGAVWLGGGIWEGPNGAAGEIGHIPGFGTALCTCGRHGHLETIAAGRSVSRRYAERSGLDLASVEIAARATDGDEHAIEVFDDLGTAVAQAMVIVANLMDVTTVVFGGGVSRAWELWSPAMYRELERESPLAEVPLQIQVGALGADAVALGAAALASRLVGDPTRVDQAS